MAATGRLEDAVSERKTLYSIKTALPEKAMYSPLNPAQHVLTIAVGVLDAQVALARADNKAALAALQGAVQAEDALAYAEPADWSLPVREMLGGLLLRTADHTAAEQVFRDDLTHNPRSGRSLLGLSAALKAQGKTYAAELVEAEFEAAWKNADIQLRVEDL